jgi:hypothetical protein
MKNYMIWLMPLSVARRMEEAAYKTALGSNVGGSGGKPKYHNGGAVGGDNMT